MPKNAFTLPHVPLGLGGGGGAATCWARMFSHSQLSLVPEGCRTTLMQLPSEKLIPHCGPTVMSAKPVRQLLASLKSA